MISSTINGSLDLVGRQPDRALQYVMVMEKHCHCSEPARLDS